jgi:hypothetical protein
METITIAAEPAASTNEFWRATAAGKQTFGQTAGEALDALTAQLSPQTSGALVLVQPMQPDQFFTAAQQERLAELMSRWRTARDVGQALPPTERVELEALVDTQLEAATTRAAALRNGLQP